MRVYIAGPYSSDQAAGVRAAIAAADTLVDMGHDPYVPHLSHFWDLISPKRYETWLRLDLAWVSVSNAVLRLPGESAGADGEVDLANKLGIRVYYRIEDLVGR